MCLIIAFLCNFKNCCFREECMNKILYARPVGESEGSIFMI